MEKLQEFYLTEKSILLALNHNQMPDEKGALKLSLRVVGLSPRRLAQYPDLIRRLNEFLDTHKKLARLIEDIDLEKWFKKELCNDTLETKGIEPFLDRLVKDNNVKLMKRIVHMLVELEECCVCMNEQSDTFFQCGHRVCGKCSPKLQKCPICRQHVLERLKPAAASPKEKNQVATENAKEVWIKYKLVEDVETFIDNRIKGIFMRSGQLDHLAKTELEQLAIHANDRVLSLFSITNLKSEELICFTIAQLFKAKKLHEKVGASSSGGKNWGKEQNLYASQLKPFLLRPQRIIRFLSVLSGGEPETKAKVNVSMSNALRRFIVQCFEALPDVSSAFLTMKSRIGFWKTLFKSIHISSKEFNKYPQAQRFGRLVRGTEKCQIVSTLGEVEHLVKSKDLKVFSTLSGHPGLFMRNFCNLITKFENKLKIDQNFEKIICPLIKQLNHSQLIELNTIIRGRLKQLDEELKVIRVKTGALHWEKSERNPSNQKSNLLKQSIHLVESELCNRQLLFENDSKILAFDSVLHENIYITKGRPPKVPSWVKTSMSAGDSVNVDSSKEVILFIHWIQPESARVDLDLSVILVDKRSNYADMVDYMYLQDATGEIIHSGDFTSAPGPDGASEFIKFCPSTYFKAEEKVKTILVNVFSFNQVNFDQLPSAIVGVGIVKKGGSGPGECNVLAACELRGASKINMAGYLEYVDENKCKFVFANTNISVKNSSRGTCSVSNNSDLVISNFVNFKHWKMTRHPCSFAETVKCFLLSASKAIRIDGQIAMIYEREKDEEGVKFRDRVLTTSGKPISEQGKVSVVYFGKELSEPLSALFNQDNSSVFVSKSDYGSEMLWTVDPFSVLIK